MGPSETACSPARIKGFLALHSQAPPTKYHVDYDMLVDRFNSDFDEMQLETTEMMYDVEDTTSIKAFLEGLWDIAECIFEFTHESMQYYVVMYRDDDNDLVARMFEMYNGYGSKMTVKSSMWSIDLDPYFDEDHIASTFLSAIDDPDTYCGSFTIECDFFEVLSDSKASKWTSSKEVPMTNGCEDFLVSWRAELCKCSDCDPK